MDSVPVPFCQILGPSFIHSFIHSFIFYAAYSIVVHGGAGAYIQKSTGKRQGTPWTGCQSIAGQHRDTQDKQPSTPNGNLNRPIYLPVVFLDCWRKPGYPVRTQACTGRTCKLNAEKPPVRSRTQDLLLQGNGATNCTAMHDLLF
ncbi:hypothetical protein CHARACLAT_010358 [Characodon lateralis]|uniref:Uncharacterized protein n=1 Tax=Characodon lateralis TaxID=208331 RepID=A0ABU7CM36_9TELE|nr:hypothetical protein [Characodon lateralis]